jgi:subtilisin family serine protease
MKARRLLACGATAAVALAATAATITPVAARGGTPRAATTTYIVTLDPTSADVATTARNQLAELDPGAQPLRVFESAIDGYTARLTPGDAAELAAEPTVAAVEPDGVMTIAGTSPQPWTADRLGTTSISGTTQYPAPWGLDRIDQRSRSLSGTYTYARTGLGVAAYIIDTGIRTSHNDFTGRARSGYDAIDGGTANDCNGHGTHVASTVGGARYGVAKRATLIGVRVLGCSGSGSTSGVIAGMDWVVAHHQAGKPAVVNMSLGGSTSTALDSAVARLTADGVTVVVAAGNSSTSASNNSPARAPSAITVAASDRNDAFASFSNYGSAVDIIAPGVSIPGAYYTSNSATATMSGTSMASPHAAGAVAKLLQASPRATPATITSQLKAAASSGRISGTRTSPNELVYSNS